MDWVWSNIGIAVALSAAPVAQVSAGGVFYVGAAGASLAGASPTAVAGAPPAPSAGLTAASSAGSAVAGSTGSSSGAGALGGAGTSSAAGSGPSATAALTAQAASSSSTASAFTPPSVGAGVTGTSDSTAEGSALTPGAHIDLTTAVISVVEVQAYAPIPVAAGVLSAAGGVAIDAALRSPEGATSVGGAAGSATLGLAPSIVGLIGVTPTTGVFVTGATDIPHAATSTVGSVAATVSAGVAIPDARAALLTGVVILTTDLLVDGFVLLPSAAASVIAWRQHNPQPGAPVTRFAAVVQAPVTRFVLPAAPGKGTRFT